MIHIQSTVVWFEKYHEAEYLAKYVKKDTDTQ